MDQNEAINLNANVLCDTEEGEGAFGGVWV